MLRAAVHLASANLRRSARCLASSSSSSDTGAPSTPAAPSTTDAKASKSKSAVLHALTSLDDEAIATLVFNGKIPAYRLEQELKAAVQRGADPDCTRAVRIRRKWVSMVQAASQGDALGTADIEAAWPTTTARFSSEGDAAAQAAAEHAGTAVSDPRVLADLPFDSCVLSPHPCEPFLNCRSCSTNADVRSPLGNVAPPPVSPTPQL